MGRSFGRCVTSRRCARGLEGGLRLGQREMPAQVGLDTSRSVASQTNRSASRASSARSVARPGVAGVGDRRRAAVRDPEAVRLERVVRHPDRKQLEPGHLADLTLGELADPEDLLEHALPATQEHGEGGQARAAARWGDQLRPHLRGARAGQGPPDPGDDVTPVIEVEVGDRDRVDERPVVVQAEPRQHPGTAIQQQATGPRGLDQVPRLGAARVRPRGGASDNRQLHVAASYASLAVRP